MIFFTNKAVKKSNTSFLWDFYRRIDLYYYFDDSRSSSGSDGQFQGHANGKMTDNLDVYLCIIKVLSI